MAKLFQAGLFLTLPLLAATAPVSEDIAHARAIQQSGNFIEARKEFQHALTKATQEGVSAGRALSLSGLAQTDLALGHYAETITGGTDARALFLALKNKAEEARILTTVGQARFYSGDFADALKDFEAGWISPAPYPGSDRKITRLGPRSRGELPSVKMRCMPLPPDIQTLQTHPYRVLEAPDASSFLRTLSPIDSPIDGFGEKLRNRSLIYRGLVSSDLSLVPKARRKSQWPYRGGGGGDTWKNRLIAEVQTILSFSELADRQGLAIPNMMGLRRNLHIQIGALAGGNLEAFKEWPPTEIVPALSLAQHCGLPTCLLDFSWNPYVAAYFAARGVMDKSSPLQDDKFICVWVVDDGQLTLTFDSPRHSIKLFVPPASDNRTLQAQEGLFMWSPVSIHDGWDAATGFDPGEPAESILSKPSSGCALTKVLLKETEAKMLLHRLIKLGVDGARLFPTYEGAARATDEHTWARICP